MIRTGISCVRTLNAMDIVVETKTEVELNLVLAALRESGWVITGTQTL